MYQPTHRVPRLLVIALVAGLGLVIGRAMAVGDPYRWLALVVVIGLLVACSKWPNLFIILYFSYSLLYSVLPPVQFTLAGMNIFVHDVFKMLAVTLIVLALRRRSEWPRSRLSPLLVIFLGLAGIETLVGLLSGYPFRYIFRDVSAVVGYVLFLFGYLAVRSWRVIRRWAMIFLIVGSFAAIYAILIRALGIEAASGFEGSVGADTIYGTMSRAYGLSGATPFYILGFFFGAALLMEATVHAGTPRPVMWLGTAACLAAILLLFGRGLFLGLLAAVAFMALALPSSRRMKLGMVGAFIVAMVFVVAPALQVPYAAELADRYLSIIDSESGGSLAQANIQGRQDELRGVWAALTSWEKIVGRGLGARLSVTISAGTEVEGYHNSIAETILKMGLVGLVVFSWFMLQMVRETIETLRWEGEPAMQAMYLALMVSFVAVAVWGFGTMGMPFRANSIACITLGMALRCRELLQSATLTLKENL